MFSGDYTLLFTKLAIEKLCYYQNKKLNTLMRSITKTITRVSCINKLTTNYFLAESQSNRDRRFAITAK